MKNKQLKVGAVLSYLSIAVNILAGMIYTPWMIQQIGPSQHGLFTLANSLITLFLVDFGLSSAVARYLSKYHAEGNQKKADEFLGAVYKLYLLVDTVIFIVLTVVYFLIDQIYVKLTPGELAQFKIVYLIAGAYSLINFPFVTLNGILTAYEKFIQLKLADLIYRFLLVGLMVLALLNGQGLYALVTVNAAAGLAVIVYKYCVIRRVTPVRVSFRNTDRSLYKEIFGFSLWVTIGTLAQRLIFNITPSILGIVASSTAISVFGVVVTIEGYVYTITSAINGMFMPKISRLYAQAGGKAPLMPLMLKVGRFQYALNGLMVVGFAVLGRSFIHLWMGNAYADAYGGILLVIIPGIFFNSLQIANTAMVVRKKVKVQACIQLITGVVNLLLSFPLSFFFGVTGASLSIFLAYTLRAVLFNIAHHKVMKLNIPRFIKQCYLRMLPPILLSLLGGVALNAFIRDAGWGMLILKGSLLVALYLVCMWFFGLTGEEKAKAMAVLSRRRAGKAP
ncbi:MAG: oligosaccharide flippase family protein [Clostridiales bacterium]|nr:oligosaccharide flippase family protein [Clostridiales bacterium]